MNAIKKQFIEDYESSVNFFNKGDVKHFLRDARLCIEGLAKIMIYEVLSDDNLAMSIIKGDKRFSRNDNSWIVEDESQNQEPEGSYFYTLLKYAIYYKYPVIWTSREKGSLKRPKRLRNTIDSDLDQMVNYYSVASELVEHTGTSKLDIIKQGKALAEFFPKFIDDLKEIFSETQSLFDNLPRFASTLVDTDVYELESELQTLYNETNNFCSVGGDKFILLLPHITQLTREILLEALSLVPCAIIFDFGVYNREELASFSDIKLWREKVRPIQSKNDFAAGNNMLNWHFSLGSEVFGDNIAYDFKSWKVSRSRQFEDILKNVVKKNSACHFYLLNFIEEPKFAPFIFNILNNVFEGEDYTKNRCDIFSFSSVVKTIKGLKEWCEDSIVKHTFLKISLEDMSNYILNISSGNQIGISSALPKAKIEFSVEEINYFREAGIEVFGQYVSNKKREWDFYSGAEITWNDLETELDVKRIGYEKFKEKIISIIRSQKLRVVSHTLKHHPGAGATTMVRRLAYDICKMSSEISNFNCCPVFLNSFNEKTFEYLLQLSEKKLDNDYLLIIVEGGKVADENVNKLEQRMNIRHRNVIILRVFRSTRLALQGGPNTTILTSKLDDADAKLFIRKYSASLKGKPIFSDEDVSKGLDVVDFPLKLKDDITSIRLNDYVGAFMNDLPETARIFLGFIAFTTYYGNKALNQNLVKSYLPALGDSSEWKRSLYKLIIQETDEEGNFTGCWRPRYQSFALPILQNTWGINWKLRINQISKEFIKECKNVGVLGQWDKDMIYAVFILRRGSDFRDAFDETRSKFSKLIQDVIENNQRPEDIYQNLVDSFSNDSILLGHYGRYLYEQAYKKNVGFSDGLYEKSKTLIEAAIDLNPFVDDNYHMLGMHYLRRIQTTKKQVSKYKNNSDFDIYSFEDTLLSWIKVATESFQKSIELNPASPYGYTSICQLYMESLKLAKLLKGSDDYSFCDDGIIYEEIIDNLGTCLNQLGNICNSYDEEQSYMIQTIRTYNQIRAFHRQLLGNAKESVEHYRKLYKNGGTFNKLFYGKQLVTSILYARTEGVTTKNKNNIAWSMGRLTAYEREEVEQVLQYQRSQNDLDVYENLFWFKMSGNEEFSLDEAINLLEEWLQLYEKNNKTGGGKLKALFYLAVCYSALAIHSERINEDYITNANKYFKQAEALAEKFERSTISEYAYLGEESDAHCILLPHKADDAKRVEALIVKVDRRKGYVKLPCGLEAYFTANDFDSLADEGKTYLIGKIGFRYSGLRLCQFERVTNYSPEQLAIISNNIDAKEETQIQCYDLDEEKENRAFGVNVVQQPTKEMLEIIEKTKKSPIKGDSMYKTFKKNDVNSSTSKTRGKLVTGVFREGGIGNPSFVKQDGPWDYAQPVRTIREGEIIVDGDKVEYLLCSEPRPNNPQKKFWFAEDVHLKE